jgi:hypothetical protein
MAQILAPRPPAEIFVIAKLGADKYGGWTKMRSSGARDGERNDRDPNILRRDLTVAKRPLDFATPDGRPLPFTFHTGAPGCGSRALRSPA